MCYWLTPKKTNTPLNIPLENALSIPDIAKYSNSLFTTLKEFSIGLQITIITSFLIFAIIIILNLPIFHYFLKAGDECPNTHMEEDTSNSKRFQIVLLIPVHRNSQCPIKYHIEREHQRGHTLAGNFLRGNSPYSTSVNLSWYTKLHAFTYI